MARPSLQGDANSLLFELNLCEKLTDKKAPGVMSFKGEISRMKMEAHILIRMATELDLACRIERRLIPRQKFDELAQAIQRLRNKILYFKSHMDVYKRWYHNDSPRSDTGNYSSSESTTMGFSPIQPRRGNGPSSAAWFQPRQPPPSRTQVQNRYSHFPSQLQSSQHLCNSCGRTSSSQSSFTDSDSCQFCGFVSRSLRFRKPQTPPHYTFPARPGM